MAFYELRRYHVKAGKLDAWLELAERKIIPFQISQGMVVCGSFKGESDETTYIWLRRFESDDHRDVTYKAVYESDYWKNEILPKLPELLEDTISVTRIVPTKLSSLQ